MARLAAWWAANGRCVQRAWWFAMMVAALALFVVAVPVRYAQLSRIADTLTPAQTLVLADALAVFGQDLATHVRLVMAIEVLVVATFTAVGLLIFWRRRDRVALLLSAGMVTFSVWLSPPLNALASSSPMWQRPIYFIEATALVLAIVILYVFPNGRYTPRWTLFLLAGVLVSCIGWVFLPDSPFNLSRVYQLSLTSFAILEFLWLTGMFAQLCRFAWYATAIERQQTKWILFGFTVGTILYIVMMVDRTIVPLLGESRMAGIVYDLFIVPLFLLVLLVVPATFAISIFRYRLFEIDLVIRRTVVYTTLTAILAGLYIASIGFFQRLFVAITGDRSEGAVVLTTLVLAAAFTPVKTGLQSLVDKHIKDVPDPTKPLRAFGDQVRSFVDLFDVDHLCRRLLQESVSALGGTSGAIYLLQDGRSELSESVGDWRGDQRLSVALEYEGRQLGLAHLGPRIDGAEYTDAQIETFKNIAAQVARTIYFVRGAASSIPSNGAKVELARP
jgi:hypothetical protein